MRTATWRRRMGSVAIVGLGTLALGSPAGATPVAGSSGVGRLTYERINQAMAAQSSVTYSTAITFEGVPILTGGEQLGYATPSSGYRAETLDDGHTPVDVLDILWYQGRAYLFGNKGGLVVAGLTIPRASFRHLDPPRPSLALRALRSPVVAGHPPSSTEPGLTASDRPRWGVTVAPSGSGPSTAVHLFPSKPGRSRFIPARAWSTS